eukprot:CAMPEP_0181179594 /NCGR_PEP_ID=MMETSP1096-20121128/6346_1 /TAXON_ID=156174 ORGANISM="Chrysochromulina ericina, Strain CCMP281" /NCGR_SAMPLE_ID=MMETSP1096 /ASSEMBLY_ACC=CAM_ASM_000453 /LENGTH=173 /DNA_ID=CAMNT_0023267959 /DNA_START=264 /DNA_END=786 /DNA_ORIENTATION=+
MVLYHGAMSATSSLLLRADAQLVRSLYCNQMKEDAAYGHWSLTLFYGCAAATSVAASPPLGLTQAWSCELHQAWRHGEGQARPDLPWVRDDAMKRSGVNLGRDRREIRLFRKRVGRHQHLHFMHAVAVLAPLAKVRGEERRPWRPRMHWLIKSAREIAQRLLLALIWRFWHMI